MPRFYETTLSITNLHNLSISTHVNRSRILIKKVFYKLGGGMRQSLNYRTIKDMKVVFPPIEEQKEIAAYLDEKCAKIDAILEKINTEVERLKELKRSLINEVVTGQRAIDTESHS